MPEARLSRLWHCPCKMMKTAGDLPVPEGNPPARKIVGREFHRHAVTRQHADVVLAHLAAQVAEHGVLVLQLDGEHRVRQRVDHFAVDGDGVRVLAADALFGRRRRSGGANRWLAVLLLLLCQIVPPQSKGTFMCSSGGAMPQPSR